MPFLQKKKKHNTYALNMIIFKSLEYSCLQICNIDNVKIIVWIYTWSKSIFQPKSNTTLRQKNIKKKIPPKDRKSKQIEQWL